MWADPIRLTLVAVRAEGTVIEYQRSLDCKGHTSYRPVVRFTPAGGELVMFVSGGGQ